MIFIPVLKGGGSDGVGMMSEGGLGCKLTIFPAFLGPPKALAVRFREMW